MTTPWDEPLRWQIDAACRDTLARAARLVDQQDYEGFAALFTEEAELQRPGGERLQGRAAILAAYRARPAQRLTRHLLAGSVIDPQGPTRASAVSQVLLWQGDAQDEAGPMGRPTRGPAVVGEFADLLVREADGRWRIARRLASFFLHEAARG